MLKVFEAVAQDGVIHLPVDAPSTAHCVVTILDENLDKVREHTMLELPSAVQDRMSELLQRNREGTLTSEESKELDALAEEFDTATLTKGSALAAMTRLRDNSRHE